MKLGRASAGKDLRVRYFWVGGFFVFGMFVLAVNLYRLMVIRHDEFLALSIDNQFKDVRVRAPRGQIRDRRGEVLVDIRPSFDVFITPAFCQKCAAEVIPQLADLVGWDEAQTQAVTARIKAAHGPQRYQPMQVETDLGRDALDRVNAVVHRLPGVDVEKVPHRNYPAGPALAHVLGYMNEVTQDELVRLNGASEMERAPYALGDYIGRRGVERGFEAMLRGKDGWRKEVVNARGEVMRDPNGEVLQHEDFAPRSGNNVVLSIDARLQAEAEKAFPGAAGAIIALDPRTGFVLAAVSRPSFDPNVLTGRVSPKKLQEMAKDPLQPMVNRVAAEHYHPGSTFKPITLIAGLRSGAFTEHTTATCGGGFRLGARVWRCHGVHGTVAAVRGLQYSCDTYFYTIANAIGIDPIATIGREFGLGQATNFSVAAEVPGVMPDTAYHDKVTPGGYQKGMALNTAIGQGDVNVTPLQLAGMYAALGTGSLYQPQVVDHVEDPQGDVIQKFEPKLVRKIDLTEDQHRIVVDALAAVVNEAGGTGGRARLKGAMSGITIAGKTGTAQVVRIGDVRLKKEQMGYFERDHAWFAAFAPAEAPEIAIVVLNEHSGHGGSESAPAASAVMQKFFELKASDSVAFGPAWQPPPPIKIAAPAPKPADGGTAALAAQPAVPDAGAPSIASGGTSPAAVKEPSRWI
ncbi:MAG: penicillin-binding protein 2 [Archangiaceae bacterium]|nr:penicillin-binding protein 2 [Archangiaceae bacterium]